MDTMVVGIDVSKDRLDVAVRPTGIEDLVACLKTRSPALVAVEATGGFEAVVAAGLAGAGLPVVVVNPAQVRAFARALGKRAKTDPIDAAVIAHFAEATKPQLRSGHRPGEALAEEDGELGLGHAPLARRHDPLLLGAVQDQEEEFGGSLLAGEMAPGLTARRSLEFSASMAFVVYKIRLTSPGKA
jgi:hypothetical protein